VKVFVSAGETSGDRHAADLIYALRQREPTVEVSGFGGRAMASAGASVDTTLIDSPIIGVRGIASRWAQFRRLIRNTARELKRTRTDVLVLVDYPGFNLRLAQAARAEGIKTAYYIGPQVWAWGEGRIERIKRDIDLLLVVFEFERALYERAGVAVRFVGHPLLDQLDFNADPSFRRRHGLADEALLVGLFPGSRPAEIDRIYPVMLEAVQMMRASHPDLQWACAAAPGLPREQYARHQELLQARITLVEDAAHSLMKASDLALVASGTATLETALLGTPLLVLYKTDRITYGLGRLLVRIPRIGLVNIVAGRELAPEFIQGRCRADLVAPAALRFLQHSGLKRNFAPVALELRTKLGQAGAAARAAQAVWELARL
jgi:lipid-A-disaccharide synthase